MHVSEFAYRVIFTINSSLPHQPPVKITARLDDWQAKVLMGMSVKSIGIAVARSGGMILDETPEPLDFADGGNRPKGK